MNRDAFLAIMNDALASIREPQLFETERGYQGELLAMLRPELIGAALPGDAIIEQEYQKRIKDHGITIRPDIIIHVPFKGGAGQEREEGNFVAIEIKRKSAEVQQAFDSLRQITEALHHALAIFLNIDFDRTHVDSCPPGIAERTVCFAVRLQHAAPVIKIERAILQ